jgi:hypothetical protein
MEFLTDLVADYPELIGIIGIAVGLIGLIVGIIGLACIRSAKKLRNALEDTPPPRRAEQRREQPRHHAPIQPEPAVMRERQISNVELRDMLHTANESAPVEIEISKYLTLTDDQKQGIFYVIIPDKQ